ncbi:MAG: hypothetical protein K0S44_1660 [Bacteroidetes bacterium]|nr:hypothetical protein [Bacteroidota bacterium]
MCGSSIPKNQETAVIDIPRQVLHTVMVMYPNAIDIEWEKDRKGNFEAEFTSDGKEVELIINNGGDIVRSEVHIKEAELPPNILDSLERKGSMRIARALEIKEDQMVNYYVIALTPTERLKLTYDKSGKLISESKVDRNKKPLVRISLPASGISSYERKWELPFILTEISGFTFINTSTIACIQDELGVIYLYDLAKSAIIREIPFAQAGDFEGITLVGNELWTLRSDGLLYQINNYQDEQPQVKEYPITLSSPQNFEGLCFDRANNRLLIVPREFDTSDPTKKGVYSFNVKEKEFSTKPIFNLDLNHSVFSSLSKKSKSAVLMPSEIAIHPVTSKIYITDARNAQVLIVNSKGEIEKLISLNRNIFVKTEGIFFNQEGEMFLSNEGKKQNANLILMGRGIE